MAKLHFYYSTMNAGKTTNLLQANYNYLEQGMRTWLFTPEFDNRHSSGIIHSRIGISAKAYTFSHDTNFSSELSKHWVISGDEISCVLIDEAQFLTKEQVLQLCKIVDSMNIPVLAYGIRNDYLGDPFEGSTYLFANADNLIELKTICHCGRKATHVVRVNSEGEVVKQGDKIQIGGNESYKSMCRKHFYKNM